MFDSVRKYMFSVNLAGRLLAGETLEEREDKKKATEFALLRPPE